MSMVMFAQLCDHCGARSEEYSCWPTCRECGEDVCPDCIVPGSASDDERHEATCKRCEVLARKRALVADTLVATKAVTTEEQDQ